MIEQAIKKAIELECAVIVDEEAKSAAERVSTRIRRLTGEIAASVLSRYTMEMRGTNELVIRVELPDKK